MALKYKRILLKFSGEALMGSGDFGLDAVTLKAVVSQVKALRDLGVEVAIVVGGGGIFFEELRFKALVFSEPLAITWE